MALAECGCGDLNKMTVLLKLFDIMSTAISHTGTKTAQHLEYGILNESLVSDTSFNAFRNKLLRVRLEVTVLTAVLHSGNGSHSTVNFIFSSLIKFEVSRALIAAREHGSHHADITAGCESLCNISGILDTAVGDDRNTVLLRNCIAVHNRSDLRNTDTCNDTCRTDRSRSDTNLDSVNAGLDQGSCSLTRCNVTGDYLKIREFLLDHLYAVDNVRRVSVRRVENNNIDLCIYKGFRSLKNICCDSDCSTAEKSSVVILCGVRILDLFLDIFDRNESF